MLDEPYDVTSSGQLEWFCWLVLHCTRTLTVQRSDAGIWRVVPRLNTKAVHGSATCGWFWSDALAVLSDSTCSASLLTQHYLLSAAELAVESVLPAAENAAGPAVPR